MAISNFIKSLNLNKLKTEWDQNGKSTEIPQATGSVYLLAM